MGVPVHPSAASGAACSRAAAPRVAVVGAGLAGLSCASGLRAAGREVTVIDKGRKPAGRMSSRRAERFAFDHGAQYFTVRDEAFAAAVDGWRRAGLVEPWASRIVTLDRTEAEAGAPGPTGPTERLVGRPSMSALAGHLAGELERSGVRILPRTRIESMLRRGPGWGLLASADPGEGPTELGPFDQVVLALPAQQAAALLPERKLRALANAVELRPCWAVMLGLPDRYEVSFDGAFCKGPLSWVARNSSKPGRPPGEAWVLHASPDWSSARLDLGREQVVDALVSALEASTGVPVPAPEHAAAHLWRFSIADRPLDEGALWDPTCGLGVAGDWCAGSRVEGAWLSGRTLAQRMLSSTVESPA